jgi:hypothetical protein
VAIALVGVGLACLAFTASGTPGTSGHRRAVSCGPKHRSPCHHHSSHRRKMTPKQRAEAIRDATEHSLSRASGGLDVAVRPQAVKLERRRSGNYWITVLFKAGSSACTFGFRYPAFYEGEGEDSNTPEMWADQLVASLHEAVETRHLPQGDCPDVVWVE